MNFFFLGGEGGGGGVVVLFSVTDNKQEDFESSKSKQNTSYPTDSMLYLSFCELDL